MTVGARPAVGWLMQRYAAAWEGDHNDFVDHLLGRDDAIEERAAELRRLKVRNVAAVTGGEIG